MDPWRVLNTETVFDAQPWLRVTRQRLALPDGRVVEDFHQVHLRPFAITVPVLQDGRILLTRAYKHGPGRVCLSFPGGFLDPGEAPAAAAAREMLEETGHAARHWQGLGQFTDNGNQKGCEGHYFLATGCHAVQPPDSGDLEEMRLECHSPDAVDGFLSDGSFAITHDAAAWAFARLRL